MVGGTRTGCRKTSAMVCARRRQFQRTQRLRGVCPARPSVSSHVVIPHGREAAADQPRKVVDPAGRPADRGEVERCPCASPPRPYQIHARVDFDGRVHLAPIWAIVHGDDAEVGCAAGLAGFPRDDQVEGSSACRVSVRHTRAIRRGGRRPRRADGLAGGDCGGRGTGTRCEAGGRDTLGGGLRTLREPARTLSARRGAGGDAAALG